MGRRWRGWSTGGLGWNDAGVRHLAEIQPNFGVRIDEIQPKLAGVNCLFPPTRGRAIIASRTENWNIYATTSS